MLTTPQADREIASSGTSGRYHSSVAFTKVSWIPRRELTPSDWIRQGRMLGSVGRGVGWWLGDWLRYGNARYGERYAMAARISGYDRQTLMNMAYVASRFEISRRREKLSFSHHAELAALPADEQERWLQHAENDRLSVHALRTEIRGAGDETGSVPAAAPATSTGPTTPDPVHHAHATEGGANAMEVICPQCGHRFARNSAGSSPAD